MDRQQRGSTGFRPSDVRIPVTEEEADAAIAMVEGKVAAVREQIEGGESAVGPARAALSRWSEKLVELRYARTRIIADAVIHPEERAALLERMRLMPRHAPEELPGVRIASLTKRLHDARCFSLCVVDELLAAGAKVTPLAEQLLRSFRRDVSPEELAAWEAEFRARLTRAGAERSDEEARS